MKIDWTVIGVIVAIAGVIIAYLQLRQTPHNKSKKDKTQKNHSDTNASTIKGSTVNTIQGDNVNVNQTIINNIRETVKENKAEKEGGSIHIPEFERAKKKIAAHKLKLRTYIYAVFASAKAQQLDPKLEVRHVQDVIEELIGVDYTITLEELKLMKEEGIIDFDPEDEFSVSPYTKIKLKLKYYSEIL